MKKLLLFSMMCLVALTMQAQVPDDDPTYVDLGLPSGTKWPRAYYTVICYDDDVPVNAPTDDQWKELITKCDWKWRRERSIDCGTYNYEGCCGHYEITGPNGNKIWIKNIGSVNYSDYPDTYKESRGRVDFIMDGKSRSTQGIIFISREVHAICIPSKLDKDKMAGLYYYINYQWPSKSSDYNTNSYLDGNPCGRGAKKSVRLITVSY